MSNLEQIRHEIYSKFKFYQMLNAIAAERAKDIHPSHLEEAKECVRINSKIKDEEKWGKGHPIGFLLKEV